MKISKMLLSPLGVGGTERWIHGNENCLVMKPLDLDLDLN